MSSRPVDLRSDTITQPTPAMQEAMAAAELGDDVLEGDPTVRKLEAKVAALLGHEEAVFVPSGTMANLLSLRAQTSPGDEIICDEYSHIVYYEGGGYAAFCGLATRQTRDPRGRITASDIDANFRPDDPHFSRTRLVVIENTHNRRGGVPWPVDDVASVARHAIQRGIAVHMDGARLWNACAATGAEPAEYARHATTVSVCFSKGLGCPVGSAVATSAEVAKAIRRQRKVVGGAMRQSGGLAAAAIHALDHHRERLRDDHRRARELGERLAGIDGLSVDLDRVHTNMVYFDIDDRFESAAKFCDAISKNAWLLDDGPRTVRAVTNLHVDDDGITRVVDAVRQAMHHG